ncbi:MAG: TIR domain-containing protein [Candidatus Aminicenantes bacterium]|nr:TIR domain-containing protein [Candidatus Aminicenantes bacterium]
MEIDNMVFSAPGIIQFHTFISYQSHDVEAAHSLTHLLQDLGLRAWWDRDVGNQDQAPRMAYDKRGKPISGDSHTVESVLSSAIADSILVTVVTSPHTLKSVWVQKEICLARQMRKPLYFWHLIEPGKVKEEEVSIRYGGQPNLALRGFEYIRAIARHYRKEYLAPSASIEFMRQLSAQGELKTIGHKISSLSGVGSVCSELNHIIELSELVLHHRNDVNTDSLQQFWPEYDRLCKCAEELEQAIYERYGRKVYAHRTPVSHGFRLKRPYALSRINHLKRLLEDDAFREREFRNIDDEESL